MIEFQTDTNSTAGHTEAVDALAVSFSYNSSGAPSDLTSAPTTTSTPATSLYSTVANCKEGSPKFLHPCYICPCTACPCDCVKYKPEDIRKAFTALKRENYHLPREEGYYRRPVNEWTKGTPGSLNYMTPRSTLVRQPQATCWKNRAMSKSIRPSGPFCEHWPTRERPNGRIENCRFNTNCLSMQDENTQEKKRQSKPVNEVYQDTSEVYAVDE